MANYDTDEDALYPDSGFAVVAMDEMKPPDEEDFMRVLQEFDSAEDVSVPPDRESYRYYVHGSDGESWTRKDWVDEYGE